MRNKQNDVTKSKKNLQNCTFQGLEDSESKKTKEGAMKNMKRVGIFFLSTCVVINTMILPVSATGLPEESEVVAETDVVSGEEVEETDSEEIVIEDESELEIDSAEKTENTSEEMESDAEELVEDESTVDVEESETEKLVEEESSATVEESDAENLVEDESTVDVEEADDEQLLEIDPIEAELLSETWNDRVSLTENRTVNGDLLVKKRVDLNGYKLTVNGNMIADADVSTGDYGILEVKGNYIQKSGYMSLGAGSTMDVSGDLKICGIDANGNEVTGTGSMGANSSSIRNIGGDYIINTSNGGGNGGTINLKGNLVDGPQYNHDLRDTTINLNGTKQQIIDGGPKTVLGTINGTNNDIKFKKYFCCHRLGKNLSIKTDEDVIYLADSSGYTTDYEIDGYTLTIPVSVIAEGGVYTGENGKLIVKGDYIQKSNNVSLGAGSTMDVSGDLKVCGLDSEGNEVKGTGYIGANASSIRNIGRNFIINTSGGAGNGGIVNLKGNMLNHSGSNFNDCTINLTGKVSKKNKQIVDMSSGGIIKLLTLKSCGDFYEITNDCYKTLEKPDHKYDKGKVTQATTKTVHGKKTFTCEVCKGTKNEEIPFVHDMFTDIKTKDWWWSAVQYAYENDIMAGSNGKFNPTGKITREQFTQVLYNCEGKPAVSGKSPFPDVADKSGYPRDAIIWANQNNIMKGKADGTFGLGNNITRQDLAVALYKYAQYKGYDLDKNDTAINSFSDSKKVSGYAKNAMNWAVSQGIISGSNGNLNPAGNANRAECASMMKKLLEKNAK